MSRSFVAASSQSVESSGSPVTAYPMTLACWMRPTTLPSVQTAFGLGSSSVSGNYIAMGTVSNRGFVEIARTGPVVSDEFSATSSVPTAGLWYHLAAVITGAVQQVFINAGGGPTSVPTTIPGSLDKISSGGTRVTSAAVGSFFNGLVAESAIWNVALGADDLAALAAGISPHKVRPDALVYWTPFLTAGTTDPEMWGGLTGVQVGAPAIGDHPNMIKSQRKLWIPKAAAGGHTGSGATSTSASAQISVTGRKGAAAPVLVAAKAVTSTVARKGALGSALLSAHTLTSVASRKGAASGTLLVAKALTSVTGSQIHGNSALVTARALTSASGVKGATASASIVAKAQTTASIRKGAASSTTINVRALLSTPARKGASGSALITGRALPAVSGLKSASMNTLLSARALTTVAAGVPAHAVILMSASAIISASGRKGAASSTVVVGRGVSSVTTKKSVSGSVVMTGRALTAASIRKTGVGVSLILIKGATSSSGRKGGRSTVLVTGRPVILLGKHAFGNVTMTVSAVLFASGVASSGALPLRDERHTGFIDDRGAGHITGANAGRIEP